MIINKKWAHIIILFQILKKLTSVFNIRVNINPINTSNSLCNKMFKVLKISNTTRNISLDPVNKIIDCTISYGKFFNTSSPAAKLYAVKPQLQYDYGKKANIIQTL